MALVQGSGMKQSSCKNEEEVAAASWTRYSVRNINATPKGIHVVVRARRRCQNKQNSRGNTG